MALSPSFTVDFVSFLTGFSPSPNLSLLIVRTRKHSSSTFRALRCETSCSYQEIEVESEETKRTKVASKVEKKKRKLRPSFHDHVRERWSIKFGSQRVKFPWQERTQQQEQEEQEHKQSLITHDSAEDSGGNALLGDPLCFSLGNRVVSAPWIHKSENNGTHFNPETEIAQISSSEGEEEPGGLRENTDEIKRVADNVGKFKKEQKIEGFSCFPVNIYSSPTDKSGKSTKGFGVDAKDFSLDDQLSVSDENAVRFVGSSNNGDSIELPWERKTGLESLEGDKWRRRNTELAEKTIPEHELRRLRNVSLRMKERIKVGAAGITQALVDTIHDKWKIDEVVKIKCEGPPAFNMKRTHEILESKSGGLVIWRSGSSLVLYRGMAYKLPCVRTYTKLNHANPNIVSPSEDSNGYAAGDAEVSNSFRITASSASGSSLHKDLSEKELKDMSFLDSLLDGLGPRFKDWSGCNPLPVDADLLPGVVPGYTPPFRLLPYGVRHSLRNKLMTFYRRRARIMPPHFALGRNKELQGLAQAMVKLWKRNAIAKIAIKRGVLNTCNERMAEELKRLTGGTLLSRNKDYIVFYRGNDFLSPSVTEALVERQRLVELQQDEEEQARRRASVLTISYAKAANVQLVAGTLAETIAAYSRWGNEPSIEDVEKMKRDFALAKHASAVRCFENKLTLAQQKFRKAERALAKVQEFLKPTELPTDLETISDEERFLFRKIGLSMKPFLLLGRRGIFDGTVENIHLHWKFRELVKVIVNGKSFQQVKHIAISLEAESGGLLVSVDKTNRGYAIIIYRGKNYQRPHAVRPKNLLTRRQALARSIELQRREALLHHISSLRERIELLKAELDEMEAAKETGNEELYRMLNDDEDDEDNFEDDDEGEEAYLETYDSADEGK